MRMLCLGAEAFEAPRSRILDYRFDVKRGWFGTQTFCVIVTVEREFRGSGRSAQAAAMDALNHWERHYLAEGADEVALQADELFDDSGYMSSQMFAGRKREQASA